MEVGPVVHVSLLDPSTDLIDASSGSLDDGGHVTQVTGDDPSLPVVSALDNRELQTCLSSEASDEPAAKRWRVETPDGQVAYMVLDLSDSFEGSESLSLSLDDKFFSENQSVVREPAEPADITQAWLTSRNDKDAAAGKGQSWRQGQWSKEETEILQNNINQYCKFQNIADPAEIIFQMSKDERKNFYRTVAKGLKRPLFSVYRRVVRMYDQKNHIGKYSNEEIQRLKELKKMYGTDWSAIGTAIGRSAASVKDKSRLIRDTCNSGKWTPEEEQLLADTVRELTQTEPGDDVTTGISWSAVAERVGTRSEKQCRTKWLNYLNWKLKGGQDWTKADDLKLIQSLFDSEAVEESQVDWVALSKDFKSARSPQWLRGKWWTLKKHVADYQSRTFKDVLTRLKTWYVNEVERRRVQVELTRMRLAKQKEANMNVNELSELEQHLVVTTDSSGQVEIETAEIDGLTYRELDDLKFGVFTPDAQHSARTGAYVMTRTDRVGGQVTGTIEVDGQQYIIENGQPVMTIVANQELAKLLTNHTVRCDGQVTFLANQNAEPLTLLANQNADENHVTLLTNQEVDGNHVPLLTNESLSEDHVTIVDSQAIGPEDVESAYLIRDSIGGTGHDHSVIVCAATDQSDVLSVSHDSASANQMIDYELAERVGQSESLTHSDMVDQTDLAHDDDDNHEFHSSVLSDHVVKVDMSSLVPGVLQDHTSSDFPQLSSLSDPMLPADNRDLLASSSDIENDKSTGRDDS